MSSISRLRRASETELLDTIRHIVDDVAQRIENGLLEEAQARKLAADVRFQMGLFIPDQMDLYDRIYGSRFERIIQQFISRRALTVPSGSLRGQSLAESILDVSRGALD